MKISILCENSSSDIGFLAEWGFSVLIETGNNRILFDTGYSDVYKLNAKKLGINLDKIDFIVLSHYHNDHSGGLKFYNFKPRKKLIIHPQILNKLSKFQIKRIRSNFEVISSENPLEFSKGIYYLGEIPRRNNFEKGMYIKDPMSDDSAIAIKSKNGTIVISGCSHSGICNICEYAKEVTGQKIYAVLGGFHLFKNDRKAVEGTVNYFKNEKFKFLFPMHCIDLPTLAQIYGNFQCKKLSSGDILEI